MAEDLELFEKWQTGDQSAGNALLHRYFQSLYHFFANKVQQDVDDLIQNTLLACARSRDKIRIKSNFRAYLFTVARNELYSYLRKRKRHQDQFDFGVTSIMDIGISPTSQLARNEAYQVLLQALRALPVEQQVLLELYYWEDLSVAELSEVLEIEPPATRARITRARRTLRKHLMDLAGEARPQNERLDDLDAWARSIRAKKPAGAS